eukprot:1446453-Rhodomonas_salina.1
MEDAVPPSPVLAGRVAASCGLGVRTNACAPTPPQASELSRLSPHPPHTHHKPPHASELWGDGTARHARAGHREGARQQRLRVVTAGEKPACADTQRAGAITKTLKRHRGPAFSPSSSAPPWPEPAPVCGRHAGSQSQSPAPENASPRASDFKEKEGGCEPSCRRGGARATT